MNNKISANGGQFSDNGNGFDLSLMEAGCQTGLSIGFDTWDSADYTVPPSGLAVGGQMPELRHDTIGLDIRVDGLLVATIPMPNGTTQATYSPTNGAVTLPSSDPNGNNAAVDPTAIETGPYDGSGCDQTLKWAHFKVDLATNGILSVWYKNSQIVKDLQTGYFPSPGRLLMAARVGACTANIEVDNLQITTIPAAKALLAIGAASSTLTGVTITVYDVAPSSADTNTIALKLNGSAVTPTSVTKTNGVTTITYDSGTMIPQGSTNMVSLTISDNQSPANTVSGDRQAITPIYFTYAVIQSTVTITKYTGPAGNLAIPPTIDGMPVTNIGDGAFFDCSGMKVIILPNSLKSIGNTAFYGCTGLTSINLPNSVTSIGYSPFQACSFLANITVDLLNPNYCDTDGVLFDKDRRNLIQYPGGRLGSYNIPNSVTNIANSAFASCGRLEGLTFGNRVTSIGDGAFYGCTGLLPSINLPNSVTHIGAQAFAFCGPTSINLPNSVTSIGYQAFAGGYGLTNITVDILNPNFSDRDGVLFNKDQDTLIQYPGARAGTYRIPNSVTLVGDSAFYRCFGLTNIILGNSVTRIGAGEFSECNGLTSIYFAGNAPTLVNGQFDNSSTFTVFYRVGASSWGSSFGGRPTAVWVGRLPEPVITWNAPGDITYGTPLSSAQLNATVNVPGDLLYSAAAGTVMLSGPAQTLTAVFTPDDPVNYNAVSKSVSVNVLRAAPVISWSNPADLVYGDALSAAQLNATANLMGVFAYSPASGTVLSAGNSQLLSVNFTPSDTANCQSATTAVKISVLKAPLTISANHARRAYGAAEPAFSANFAGFVNGDTAAVISGAPSLSTAATTASPVGAYPIAVGVGTLSAANYSLGPFTDGTLTVVPAGLAVTAGNASRAYGSANPVFSASFSGFVNGETPAVVSGAPSLSTAATAASSAGTYPIVAGVGTLSAANYSFGPFADGSLTVVPVGLTVTVNPASRAYGSANPAFSASFSGLVNGDTPAVVSGTPSWSTPATAASAVGTYPIVAALGTLNAGNYSFAPFVDGTLTVVPATLTVSADDQSRAYGGTNPVFTATYRGFVNGENPGVLVGGPALSTVAGANSPVGNYPIEISPGTLTNANYGFNLTAGTLTITPGALTVSADSTNRLYGTANPTLSGTLIGAQNGDLLTATFTTPAGSTSAVGQYAITPVFSDPGGRLGNYRVTTNTGMLTVGPAALAITANNQSKTYGQALLMAGTEFKASGLANGDTVASVTLTSAGAGATATVAGSPYSIVPSGATGTGLGNYTLSYQPGALTVNPAALAIAANNQSKTYGQALLMAGTEFKASGLANGDTVASVTLTSAGAGATATVAGSPYSIVPSGATGTGLGNYSLSYQPGELTVNPAALTVSGLTANSKRYDGTTTATLNTTGATLAGVLATDTANVTLVTSGATGAFADKNPGTGKTVAISGLTLSGSAAGNYTLTQPTATADITANLELKITNPALVGRSFHVAVSTTLGPLYTLEYKNSLTQAVWTAAQTLPGTGGAITLTNSAGTDPVRFYRVRAE